MSTAFAEAVETYREAVAAARKVLSAVVRKGDRITYWDEDGRVVEGVVNKDGVDEDDEVWVMPVGAPYSEYVKVWDIQDHEV